MQRVQLAKYSRLWKWKFRKEKALLLAFLHADILEIHHVGSTAVPGMIAKPIVDIVATVTDFDRAFDLVHRIEQLGYKYLGEKTELRQYSFVKGSPAKYHLYIEEKSADVFGRKAFRDILRRNKEVASRYAELKRALVHNHVHDMRAYQDGKLQFILDAMETAGK